MSQYTVQSQSLTSVANAIRTKTSSNATLEFPNGFVTAIGNISSGESSGTYQAKIGIMPTESSQTITPDSGYDALSSVQINAISSSYVGSNVPTQAAQNIMPGTSDQTIASGTYLTGNQIIKGDANLLPSNIISGKTIFGISGTASVAGTARTSADLTVSGATVTAPAGTYASAASKSVASGSATTPATTITANPTISVSSGGLITAAASATQSVTPTVSAGYVSSGTAGTITVSGSNTSQLTAQAAQTIHPSTTDQTITSGKYLTGAQTVKAVTTTNLTAENIKSGVVIKIGDSTDDDCVTSVTGSYTGGSASIGTKTTTNSDNTVTSLSFSSLSGTPKAFFLRCTSQLTRSSSYSYYYIVSMRYNGTNTTGNYWRMSNGTFYNDTSHYSYTYSNGTLTLSSSAGRGSAGGSFYNGSYELVYIY